MRVVWVEKPAAAFYGLWTKTSDSAAKKDIPALARRYYSALGKEPGSVLPFVVLSKNYNQADKSYDLFVGGVVSAAGLDEVITPAGVYGSITVRPALGFLWGLAIGRAKRNFYKDYLPGSGYAPVNMEYEYHTEKSVGKKPEVSVYFAVTSKVTGEV